MTSQNGIISELWVHRETLPQKKLSGKQLTPNDTGKCMHVYPHTLRKIKFFKFWGSLINQKLSKNEYII